MARACYRRGKNSPNTTEKKAFFDEGLEYAQKSLAITDVNFAVHKWMAILVNEVAALEGNKAKILQSFVMRKHMEVRTSRVIVFLIFKGNCRLFYWLI